MLKKNIARTMAAATVLTAAAPMANVVFADVIDSTQAQEIKDLKEKVYNKFNMKYTKNQALLKTGDLPGDFVHSNVYLTVDNGNPEECKNYAEFEAKFDKAFSKLNNGQKITVAYDSKDESNHVRVLEDGEVVNFEEAKYEDIKNNGGIDAPSGMTIVYGELADGTPYAKIPLTDGYLTVKNGDVKLDLTRPQFKVVDGYYVDANGNSIKKFNPSTNIDDVNEVKELGGVVEGYYADTTAANDLKEDKGTYAIVKTSTAATKEDAVISDLYDASTGRLTKKGNELRKMIAKTPAKGSASVEDKLQVKVYSTSTSDEEIETFNKPNYDTLDETNIKNIKVVFEQRDNAHSDWNAVYELTITKDRGSKFIEVLNFVLANKTNDKQALSMPTFAGLDRYETSIEISKKWEKSDAVVLVSGANDKLVDGLTATPLAASLDAPVLLTKADSIPQEVIDRIVELEAKDVYIVGGTSAVSEDIETLLTKTYKKNVTRLNGDDRYETSLAVAEEMLNAPGTKELKDVFVVGGRGEADALSVSSVAGMKNSPILLTRAGEVDKDLKHFLDKNLSDTDKITDIFLAGGKSSVSTDVQNTLVDLGYEVERLAGEGRQETNAAVIDRFADDTKAKKVIVAKSNNASLVDALSAGALGAELDAHIVLATDKLTESQEDALKKVDKNNIIKTYQAGYGVSDAVAKFIKGLK